MPDKYAIFVLSTDRCGTQWLQTVIDAEYSDQVVATHEPLGFRYHSRSLAAGKPIERLGNAPEIEQHFKQIENILNGEDGVAPKHYMECGWPAYGAIPTILNKFSGRIKLIHLTRHPVLTASSLATHNYFGAGRQNLLAMALRTPFDPCVAYADFAENWPQLNQYERCLYHWAELNAWALDVTSETSAPHRRYKFEDLVSDDNQALNELLTFLELEVRPGALARRSERIDEFQFQSVED